MQIAAECRADKIHQSFTITKQTYYDHDYIIRNFKMKICTNISSMLHIVSLGQQFLKTDFVFSVEKEIKDGNFQLMKAYLIVCCLVHE